MGAKVSAQARPSQWDSIHLVIHNTYFCLTVIVNLTLEIRTLTGPSVSTFRGSTVCIDSKNYLSVI